MSAHDLNSTVQLNLLASQLFGEEWAGAVSRFTGISLRNCQRARAAAAADEDERRAGAILEALVMRLDTLTPQIQRAFSAQAPRPNPFEAKPLPKHVGIALTMTNSARGQIHDLLHRAAKYRDHAVDEKVLFPLAYDLRKARDQFYFNGGDPLAAPETVTVRALWPLLLFQLKLLRTTCGYISTSANEVAVLDELETAIFDALELAYPVIDDAEDVIAAWHEMGMDPRLPSIDDLVLSRSAWFLNATTAKRKSCLVRLLESASDLYSAVDGEAKDSRPLVADLDAWIGRWPEIDF